MIKKNFITKPAYIDNPPKPPVTKKEQPKPNLEESLEGLLKRHSDIIVLVEELEEEKDSIQRKLRDELKGFSKEELLRIYPRLKDSTLKYEVFKMIQDS